MYIDFSLLISNMNCSYVAQELLVTMCGPLMLCFSHFCIFCAHVTQLYHCMWTWSMDVIDVHFTSRRKQLKVERKQIQKRPKHFNFLHLFIFLSFHCPLQGTQHLSSLLLTLSLLEISSKLEKKP